jgi:uncharacterized membrane protein YhhN
MDNSPKGPTLLGRYSDIAPILGSFLIAHFLTLALRRDAPDAGTIATCCVALAAVAAIGIRIGKGPTPGLGAMTFSITAAVAGVAAAVL